MDAVGRLFDEWAGSGRAGLMEREHGRSVRAFLAGVRLGGPSFSFLDVGCGNGWAVRMIARAPGCGAAVGIDKSGGMVRLARSLAASEKEEYAAAALEEWDGGGRMGRFDYAFAMESLYYADSMPAALRSVRRLLRRGGTFFCGTDYYGENAATAGWGAKVGLRMHSMPRAGWRRLFRDAGFDAATRLVKDPGSRKKWRREMGTLFVTGTKR